MITTKKFGNRIVVYKDGMKVWTHWVDGRHSSWGATKYRKYAIAAYKKYLLKRR